VTHELPNTPSARGSECTALELRKRETFRRRELLTIEAAALGAVSGVAAALRLPMHWWFDIDDPILASGAVLEDGRGAFRMEVVSPRRYVDEILERTGNSDGQLEWLLRNGLCEQAQRHAETLGPLVHRIVLHGCNEILARWMIATPCLR
jgi:hypothetical protein